MARKDLDWDAIERDYRIGQLTIRQIQKKYGVSNGGMMARAKKEGWTRDLSEAVKFATKAKVRQKVVEHVKALVEQSGEVAEQATIKEIDLAANINATIILGQQRRVGRLSAVFERVAGELEEVTGRPERIEEIAQAIAEDDPKAADSIRRLKTLTSRLNNLKTATEVMSKLTAEENVAFRLAEVGARNSFDDLILEIEKEENMR